MRNLNEPRKNDPMETQPEARVISMENRRTVTSSNPMEDLRSRWAAIQASFVDNPRKAVQEADALLEEVIRSQKPQIEKGSEASTEDFRLALQRYRTMFERLSSM